MPVGQLFSAKKYNEAFLELKNCIDAEQWQMLKAFLHAPHHTLTAKEAAKAAGHEEFEFFNAKFGRLSSNFCKILDFNPKKEWNGGSYKTSVLAILEKTARDEEYRWRLRPEVVEYLRTIEADLDSLGKQQ
ncbi:MAG: hypothetical protein ACRYGC_09570 [Janthinobacterium lividum]